MTPEEFCVWLAGFASAANSYNITPKQWEEVREKLHAVFSYDTTDTYKTIPSYDWKYSTTLQPSMRITELLVEYVD